MLIAIVSDIHDNLPNFDKFLALAKKEEVETLLICGDTGNQETLDYIKANFKGKIYVVLGNMDKLESEAIQKIKISNLKIAMTHFPDQARELALTQNYDFVFYGHTHKPWLEEVGACFLANPGNLANQFYRPSFALLDAKTKKLSLKILE